MMSDRLFRIDVSKAESLEAEEALASLMADGCIVAVPTDLDRAITTVAKQLISNAAREIEWEGMPEIGERDWGYIVVEMARMTPDQPEFNEAIAVLEERVGR